MENFAKIIHFSVAINSFTRLISFLWTLHSFQDCYFACEYHGGYIALRDAKGLYLAPIGSRAALKTRSNTVTKDELFSLEDSLPQASFVAASNTRYVSVKQGRSWFSPLKEV